MNAVGCTSRARRWRRGAKPVAGRIVAADALNQTMEEGLTRVLVAEGMLTQQELARIDQDVAELEVDAAERGSGAGGVEKLGEVIAVEHDEVSHLHTEGVGDAQRLTAVELKGVAVGGRNTYAHL